MSTEIYINRSSMTTRLAVGTAETVEVHSVSATLLAALVAVTRSRPPYPDKPYQQQPGMPG